MKTTWSKTITLAIVSVWIMLMAAGCSAPSTSTTTPAPSKTQTELFVSAAASLTDVMNELSALYAKKEPDVKLTFSFGASGALQTQIEEGAPADLFLSAAQKQMTALEEKALLLEGTKKDLLVNKVVLIVPSDSTKEIKSFEDAATDKADKIALGEPKGVPVGQYSEEIFTYLNLLDVVKAKAVYGSDVRQVLTWVESGETDCGVVYATDAATTEKVKVAAQAPAGSHKPVVYPAAVLKASKYPDEAKAFLSYLSGDEAKAVFEKAGFEMK